MWATLCSSMLMGCSGKKPDVEPQPGDLQREFSEQEKRAARALSISNIELAARAEEEPYAQALLCRHGLAELAGFIDESAGLNGEHEEALRQAEALYDQRLRDLAGASGKPSGDIPRDLERTAQENPNRAANVRTAVACLQELQRG